MFVALPNPHATLQDNLLGVVLFGVAVTLYFVISMALRSRRRK